VAGVWEGMAGGKTERGDWDDGGLGGVREGRETGWTGTLGTK
jgi:hypothetical protein